MINPAQATALRILHLEDEPEDQEIARDLLTRNMLRIELLQVATREEYLRRCCENPSTSFSPTTSYRDSTVWKLWGSPASTSRDAIHPPRRQHRRGVRRGDSQTRRHRLRAEGPAVAPGFLRRARPA